MAASLGYQVGEFAERSRAQQQLAEKEESYRVLTETASDGIITVDAAGAILFVNAAAAAMFGYTREELTGADLTVLVPESLREAQKAAMAQAIKAANAASRGQRFPLRENIGMDTKFLSKSPLENTARGIGTYLSARYAMSPSASALTSVSSVRQA